jgi:hypothetical protein
VRLGSSRLEQLHVHLRPNSGHHIRTVPRLARSAGQPGSAPAGVIVKTMSAAKPARPLDAAPLPKSFFRPQGLIGQGHRRGFRLPNAAG